MSIKTLTLRSAAALMLACLTSPAWADWQNGLNVIRFDNTNPDRLVFGQSTRDDQQTQSNLSQHNTNKGRTHNFFMLTPAGWHPGNNYGSGERMTHSWPDNTVSANIVRSNGVAGIPVICRANSTSCGSATYQTISSSVVFDS